jgi:hypothetical protein
MKKVTDIINGDYKARTSLKGNQKAVYDTILWGMREALSQCNESTITPPETLEDGTKWNGKTYASKTQAYAAYKSERSNVFGAVQVAIDKTFGKSIKVFGSTFNGIKACELLNRTSWDCKIHKGDNAGRTHGIGSYIGINTDLLKLLVFENVSI